MDSDCRNVRLRASGCRILEEERAWQPRHIQLSSGLLLEAQRFWNTEIFAWVSQLSRRRLRFSLLFALVSSLPGASAGAASAATQIQIQSSADGSYAIQAAGIEGRVLRATAAVKVDGRWLHAADYPEHIVSAMPGKGALGEARDSTILYTGRKDAPDLLLNLRTYVGSPFGEIQLTARNSTGGSFEIQSLRLLKSGGEKLLNLGGPAAADRVLSDSFSEDRPAIQIRDLTNAENQVHRGVGSQLVYNRQSKQSWFIGALTSDKFLSVLRLHMAAGDGGAAMSAYEVDSTGTTELLRENSLQDSPEADRVELSVPLAPGGELASERMLFSVSEDYHEQLETYAHLIRDLHHARVSAPTPLGWWSWTAYYFGLNEGTALTNAQWLAQNLKSLGYDFFHMDEGYQFARGEYATPDAGLFPHGVATLERGILGQGLTPGIWTAPFQVSERSYVYMRHPEWLVHNAQGKPIHLGVVTDGKDQLYPLDTTNPEAQAYLRGTYSTLVDTWGIRYIKMDFMEDSAVEGYYYRPHTTALEAQRIGIKTIRDAVGENVLLDKDGCELLNPVGLVDMGRISQDTGHTFSSSKDAAPGVAARYYMNRNYFVADPDAFSVSSQTVDDQSWHGGTKPLTLDEAEVSIALSAVSGGLSEIGDDLPTLGESAERLGLVKNRDLIDMARLGRASTPLDLMTYESEDLQPSIFLLKQDERQSIVTVFDWSESPRSHTLPREMLRLDSKGAYSVTDILDPKNGSGPLASALAIRQPPHSVRMFKIVNTNIPATPPAVTAKVVSSGSAGETLAFHAQPASEKDSVLRYVWDFGDGVALEGADAVHAYTHAGEYTVHLRASGFSSTAVDRTFHLAITGTVMTKFMPERKQRLVSDRP
jgi:alpha-galactosidase